MLALDAEHRGICRHLRQANPETRDKHAGRTGGPRADSRKRGEAAGRRQHADAEHRSETAALDQSPGDHHRYQEAERLKGQHRPRLHEADVELLEDDRQQRAGQRHAATQQTEGCRRQTNHGRAQLHWVARVHGRVHKAARRNGVNLFEPALPLAAGFKEAGVKPWP